MNENIDIAKKAAEDIDDLKDKIYDVFGSDNELYQNIDESQRKLQEYIVQHPSFSGFEDGGDTYASGGKTTDWWNEKVSLSEFLFGKTKKYEQGGKSPSLFAAAKAKQQAAAQKSKTDKYENIELSETNYPGISQKLKEIDEIRGRIEEDETALATITGEVKEIAKDKFLDLYEKDKRNPNTFKLRGELGGCIMVIPQDRYISITAERAKDIQKEYGDEWVDAKDEFIFNNDLLQKYEEVISDLIKNSSSISDDDKPNLIKAKTSYSIKKGSIDNIYDPSRDDMNSIFRAIDPVFQLKNCK